MPKDILNNKVLQSLRMKVEDLADTKSRILKNQGFPEDTAILFMLSEILNLIDQTDEENIETSVQK